MVFHGTGPDILDCGLCINSCNSSPRGDRVVGDTGTLCRTSSTAFQDQKVWTGVSDQRSTLQYRNSDFLEMHMNDIL